MLHFILDNQIKLNLNSCLVIASGYCHLDAIKLLVDNGVDIHHNDDAALRKCGIEWSRLHEVDKMPYINTIEYLLEHGANINAGGGALLIRNIMTYQVDVIKLLLRHGADLALLNNYLAARNVNTDLQNTIKLLLELNIDPVKLCELLIVDW